MLWRDPGLPGQLWAALLFPQRCWGSFVCSYLVILSAKWDGGFAACRLFPSCGIGDCWAVSSLEIAGIADSKQNSVRAVHRNLAQPLKPQSNPPPKVALPHKTRLVLFAANLDFNPSIQAEPGFEENWVGVRSEWLRPG